MKKALLPILMLFLVSVVMYGQQEVTKFLGIPVDGSKSKMIRQLKKKGFKRDFYYRNFLKGEFNGVESYLQVVTVKKKVRRIAVWDAYPVSDVTDIKMRFNELCRQFQDNEKYLPVMLEYDSFLSDEEDISYEMNVNDKRYESAYYQLPDSMNSDDCLREMKSALTEKYTIEQLADTSKEFKEEMKKTLIVHMYELLSKRVVWFTICKNDEGKYYISIYYDNEYNQANGEDL